MRNKIERVLDTKNYRIIKDSNMRYETILLNCYGRYNNAQQIKLGNVE